MMKILKKEIITLVNKEKSILNNEISSLEDDIKNLERKKMYHLIVMI